MTAQGDIRTLEGLRGLEGRVVKYMIPGQDWEYALVDDGIPCEYDGGDYGCSVYPELSDTGVSSMTALTHRDFARGMIVRLADPADNDRVFAYGARPKG
jgi:hypothetical protein